MINFLSGLPFCFVWSSRIATFSPCRSAFVLEKYDWSGFSQFARSYFAKVDSKRVQLSNKSEKRKLVAFPGCYFGEESRSNHIENGVKWHKDRVYDTVKSLGWGCERRQSVAQFSLSSCNEKKVFCQRALVKKTSIKLFTKQFYPNIHFTHCAWSMFSLSLIPIFHGLKMSQQRCHTRMSEVREGGKKGH